MPIAQAIRDAQKAGSFIRKMFEEGAALKKQHGSDKVFDFSIGNPDVEPPKEFHDTLLRLVNEDAPGSHGYMPNPGYPFVRDALAKKVSREHKVQVDGNNIIMSVGAAGALNSVLKAILNPGDEVIVSKPYFVEYGSYISNHGGKMILVESDSDFNLNTDAIASALNEKTAAVLINSPHNPTGKVYPLKNIQALASVLREHGDSCGRYPYLIADEPYREIVYGGLEAAPILSEYEESIVVTSYSKSLSLPGERIGYIAVGPKARELPELVAALAYTTRVLGYVNAPALMQRVVAELTESRVNTSIYKKRRDLFKTILDDAGIEYVEPEGAFYLFCKVPAGKNIAASDDAAFVQLLKEELVLAVPGTGFGAPGWFRLAYCVDESIIKASAAAFRNAVAKA